jgi:hypothetical protein
MRIKHGCQNKYTFAKLLKFLFPYHLQLIRNILFSHAYNLIKSIQQERRVLAHSNINMLQGTKVTLILLHI